MRLILAVIAGTAVALTSAAQPAVTAPLVLETKIMLGDVSGRIDHFAIDLARQRLFVAELGNDSVGVIDLKTQMVIRTITGLKEPQGVGYVPSTDTLYVSDAGDGSVHLFQGADLSPSGHIELGADADNIRVDMKDGRVFIGYGSGALAVIDSSSHTKVADISLEAHPEAFEVDHKNGKVFVNVPDAEQIAVVDVGSGKQVATWALRGVRSNFPMAFDNEAKQVIVAFREPAKLMIFGAKDGHVVATLDTCGDADDIFANSERHRLYVSCGDGFIDVFETTAGGYGRIARIPTALGARTSFLAVELKKLFVAVRATRNEPAAIWVFKAQP